MTQTPAHAAHNSSRLTEALSRLNGRAATVEHHNLADSLGRLIDLSDSITLADSLRRLKRTPCIEPEESPEEDLKEGFLAFRQEIMSFITNSFTPDAGDLPFKLPIPGQRLLSEEAAFQPYQKFYALHQSEMEYRILKLRSRVKERLAGQSPELAQLAALDTAMGDTLSVQARKLFAGVPRALSEQFEQLRNEHKQTIASQSVEDDPQQWIRPGGWLHNFYQDMQRLLLAELDVRLQLVLGLIEAFDLEVAKHP